MATPSQKFAFKKAYGGNQQTTPSYMEQEVMSWSKEKITLKTYDFFIVACKRNDVLKMNKTLLELMGSLNFEYSDLSTRLFRLYEYCQKCILDKNFDEALRIITDLRNTWAKTFNLN